MLTLESVIVIAVLLSAFALLLTDRLSSDLVAVLVILSLIFSRILTIEEAFAGFSSPVIVSVGSLFVVCGGLQRTGISALMGNYLASLSGRSELRTVAAVMAAGALLSSVMTNVAATAILLPGVMTLCRKTQCAPSRLLIPLSYGTILGGTLTLVGTQPNIIVSSLLRTVTGRELNFFDFTPIGIVLVVSGITYMALFGRHLLPLRTVDEKMRHSDRPEALPLIYRLEERLYELKVPESSRLVGQTLVESGLGSNFGINVIGIMRKDKMRFAPRRRDVIGAGDRLLVQGREDDVDRAVSALTLDMHRKGELRQEEMLSREVGVAEIVLPPRSHYLGKPLKDVLMRDRFDVSVLAIWRKGRPIRAHLGDEVLQFGDALLLRGSWRNLDLLQKTGEFIMVSGAAPGEDRGEVGTMLAAAVMLAGMVVAVATGLLTLPLAALSTAVLMVLTRCLSLADAYKAVEWRIIILIAGFMPLGTALVKTGLVDLFVNSMVSRVAEYGQSPVIGALFLLSSAIALVSTNITAAILMGPIAMAASESLAMSPEMLLLSVAIGASIGFMTPVAQQANLLVMGPGNYVFKDYVKAGTLLSLLLFAAVMLFLPLAFRI